MFVGLLPRRATTSIAMLPFAYSFEVASGANRIPLLALLRARSRLLFPKPANDIRIAKPLKDISFGTDTNRLSSITACFRSNEHGLTQTPSPKRMHALEFRRKEVRSVSELTRERRLHPEFLRNETRIRLPQEFINGLGRTNISIHPGFMAQGIPAPAPKYSECLGRPCPPDWPSTMLLRVTEQ